MLRKLDKKLSITKESQNPEDIDPGVYEVILGPDAVSTILVFLSVYGFNAKSKVDGTSPIEINVEQFDEKINLEDDPHKEGALNFKIDASGAPKKKIEIITNGIPKTIFIRGGQQMNLIKATHFMKCSDGEIVLGDLEQICILSLVTFPKKK